MRRRLSRPARGSARALAGVAALLLLTAACGELKTPTEPLAEGPSGSGFSFERIQGQIFTPTCARSGCHAPDTGQAGLVLSAGNSYTALVGQASTQTGLLRVEAGAPERSYLLKKLRGDGDIVGGRMPEGGPPLTAAEIEGIAGWIRAGAPRGS